MRILLLGVSAFAVSLCAGGGLAQECAADALVLQEGCLSAGSRAAVGLEVLARDIGCCEYLYKKPGFCVIIK